MSIKATFCTFLWGLVTFLRYSMSIKATFCTFLRGLVTFLRDFVSIKATFCTFSRGLVTFDYFMKQVCEKYLYQYQNNLMYAIIGTLDFFIL